MRDIRVGGVLWDGVGKTFSRESLSIWVITKDIHESIILRVNAVTPVSL